jgi:hypothetical protein
VREILAKDKRQLLEDNHIQGSDSARVNLGAFYNDKLVAVMTFSKPRFFINRKSVKGEEWELSRFAIESGCVIVGIASKMLVHFQRNNDWDKIYTYADLRWSVVGSTMYDTLKR